MNPDDYQRMMHQAEEAMRNATSQGGFMGYGLFKGPYGFLVDSYFWTMVHPVASWWIIGIYSTLWLFAIWDCLRSLQGVDRLTWLVVLLAIPVFGIVFYFINNTSFTVGQSVTQRPIAPSPAPKSGSTIAAEISASIAESVRVRKSK